MNIRPGSPAAWFHFLLFLAFFGIGLLLVLLGFDLDRVDLWLERQGGWIEGIASLMFRATCALVVLVCAYVFCSAVYGFFTRRRTAAGDLPRKGLGAGESGDAPGLGCAFLSLIVGYFAWFGMYGN